MTEFPEKDNLATSRKAGKKAGSWVQRQLVKWMPLGGSSGILIHSVFTQDWLTSILSAPFTLGSLFWLSYSDGFMASFAAAAEELGDKDGKEAVKGIEALREKLIRAVQWRLAKTDDKYLKCQANQVSTIKTEGFAGVVHQLDQIFVPLSLSMGSNGLVRAGFNPFRKPEKELERMEREGVRVWSLIKKAKTDPVFRRIAVQAWGGYGKTTLMRHIAFTLGKNRQPTDQVDQYLPVLIYLRELQKNPQFKRLIDNGGIKDFTLPQLIEEIHLPSLPGGKKVKLPSGWAEGHLYDGEMLVMFDGFDEVRKEWRGAISAWIYAQMEEYQKSIFFVTSRPGAFNEDYAPEHRPDATVFVQPFNRNQQKDFIQQWYFLKEYRELELSALIPSKELTEADKREKAQSEAERKNTDLLIQLSDRKELRDLAKNPLLLNMIVNLHDFGSNLPQRRVELYQDICTLQLRDRPRARNIQMLLPDTKSQPILQEVALAMLIRQDEPRILYEDLVELAAQQIHKLDCDDLVDVYPFLKQIEEVSELIVKHDYEHEFSHWSFQGFLAAKALVELGSQGLELIQENIERTAWEETIVLYAGLIKPEPLLKLCCDLETATSIELGLKCLREQPRKISQEIKSKLRSLHFKNLEKYLRNQDFENADFETWRVMLKIVGRDEQDYLREEDIKGFPCEELRMIDELWMQYSQTQEYPRGKFGFSIQKKIWYDCTTTSEEPESEIYNKFATTVGWFIDDQQERYGFSKLDFSVNGVSGHLPFWIIAMGSKRGMEISLLSWRLANCNI